MKKRRANGVVGVVANVRAIYDELANRPIERNCIRRTECCQFKLTGRTPYLTKGEAITAAVALRATGRTRLPKRLDGACPFLGDNGRCLIYADRPFSRTHFCAAAGGPYSRGSQRPHSPNPEIDCDLGGDGSALPAAVRMLLRNFSAVVRYCDGAFFDRRRAVNAFFSAPVFSYSSARLCQASV